MFKQFLNGGSLKSLMRFDADNDGGTPDPKAALREQIAKGNLPTAEKVVEENIINPDDLEKDDEDDDKDNEPELDADGNPVVKEPETDEAKAAREAEEKAAAKLARKQDRMQRRIDEATAKQKAAEAEVARLKAVVDANPDQKLTEEEVQVKADAIVKQRLAEKEMQDLQTAFENDCNKLQSGAKKIDKDFDDKIADVAEQFGPIPSFMIGALSDLENGAEVLAHIANDDDIAEKIWGFKNKPAKMTLELVNISNKLLEANKKPRKEISKVPDPGQPVKGSRNNGSTTITQADTKNMDVYTKKRMAQIAENRKARGF